MRGRYSKSIFKLGDLVDPDADRIIFWDDSADAAKFLAVGTSLSLSGTTLNAIQNLRTTDSPTFAGLSIGTGELTCGSINRASGTLTIEIGGTAELSITSTATTFGGNIIMPDGSTLGQAAGPLMAFDNTNDYLEITGCKVGIGDTAPGTLVQLKGADAYLTLQNSTAENGQDGAETRIIFEDHANAALAQIQGHHENTSDDTKGGLAFFTHTGSALTEAMRINESQQVGIGISPLNLLHLYHATLPKMQFTNSTSGAAVGDGFQIYLSGSDAFMNNKETGELNFGTSDNNRMVIGSGGKVAIAVGVTTVGDGKLLIDQESTTGGMPVLMLDQADVSEEFFKFVGESTTDNSQSLIDAADLGTAGSIKGWLRIYVEDVQATNPIDDANYWIPFYATPTT